MVGGFIQQGAQRVLKHRSVSQLGQIYVPYGAFVPLRLLSAASDPRYSLLAVIQQLLARDHLP